MFTDNDHFIEFMRSLVKRPSAYLDELETRVGHVSLFTVEEQEQLGALAVSEEHLEEIDWTPLVADPYIARVMNAEAEIQIADSVYKVTRAYVFRAHEEYAADLKRIPIDAVALEKSADFELTPNVFVYHERRRGTIAAQHSGGKNSEMDSSEAKCYSYWTSNRRLRGFAWIDDLGYYKSIGVEVKAQRRRWGFLWWYSKAVSSLSIGYRWSATIEVTELVPSCEDEVNAQEECDGPLIPYKYIITPSGQGYVESENAAVIFLSLWQGDGSTEILDAVVTGAMSGVRLSETRNCECVAIIL